MAAVAQSIRRSAIGLGLFAVITGGTIAVTQVATEERIREQAARAEAQALYEIIPESRHNNDLLRDTVQLPASERLAQPDPLNVWVARQNEQPIGMIMPVVAPDGYSGKIHLLVGVDMTGTILGVRVTSHKETPGLGGEVENPAWQALWPGKTVYADGAPAIELVKSLAPADDPARMHQVDALSGATMTSRGVENLVNLWVGDLGYGPYLKSMRGGSA